MFFGAKVLIEKEFFVTRIVTLFAIKFMGLGFRLRCAYFFEHYMHFYAHKNMHLDVLERCFGEGRLGRFCLHVFKTTILPP